MTTERKNKQRYTPLKIKVCSLAAESRIIRSTEKMCLQQTRWLNVRLRLTDGNTYTPAQIERIVRHAKVRVTFAAKRAIKPMTDEARDHCIKSLNGWEGEFHSLYSHRLGIKKETRAAHLAYGFLRGTPFKAMEKYSYTAPPLERAEYHVLKFRGITSEQAVKQRFAEWVESAADWKKPKGKTDDKSST